MTADQGMDVGLDPQRTGDLLAQATSLGELRRFLGAAVQRFALSTTVRRTADRVRQFERLTRVMDTARAHLVPLDAELVDRLLALIPPPDGSALLRLLGQLAEAGYPRLGSLVMPRLQGLFALNLQAMAALSHKPAVLLAAADALFDDSFQLSQELLPPPMPEVADAPRPIPPEVVLEHGLVLAQGLGALEVAQSSTGLLGAFLTKVLVAVQHGGLVEAHEALGQAQDLLRVLDVDVARAMAAVVMKIEAQRRENDADS